jgi:hypothetical protein
MDLVKPEQSQLYHNAAIPAASYDAKTINDAQQITDRCNANAALLEGHQLASELHRLCNEKRTSYQADYYHVITSSFLNCRGEIAWEREAHLPSTILPFMYFADESTRASQEYFVRNYKYDRFVEEIQRAKLPYRISTVLLHGLEAIRNNQSPYKTLNWYVLMSNQPQDVRQMVTSILERYKFEINFRVYQHALGARYAQGQCAGNNSYGDAAKNLQREQINDRTRLAQESSGLGLAAANVSQATAR